MNLLSLLFLLLVSLAPTISIANFINNSPLGFHWYNSEGKTKENTNKTIVKAGNVTSTVTKSPSPTPYQHLQYLTMQTRNTLANAILNPTVENTTKYMRAQQYWAMQDQKLVRSWQEALLVHPELDYRLNFPTDNNAIPIKNNQQNALVEKTLSEMPKHYGLILFYRGKSSIDQKFINEVLLPLVKSYQFSMISVTIDNKPIIGLANPKSMSIEQINHSLVLKANYLPALFLVNLRSNQMTALNYGFISSNDLKLRFLDVVNQFKRYSYQGLGGN